MSTPLADYFVLPDNVKTVQFVHQINEEATPERILKTVTSYEVTPSIVRNLDRALNHVQGGIEEKRSILTWIHGSFGCGKSHFMNVLSLIMADELVVFEKHPELQEQKAKYQAGVIDKKLFRLHVHCISRNKRTLEDIVFGAAVDELKRLHPDAPSPPIFRTDELFKSAKSILEIAGDEKFFASLNGGGGGEGAAESKKKWGKLSKGWDRDRFEAAIADPSSDDAHKLQQAMAKSDLFAGQVAQSDFVELGPGLKALASHLQGLGYEGVVLFLDELVLWLSSLREDKDRLTEQATRVSTLVEHGDFQPSIPFLTFAARQRNLSDMVGNFAVGEDEKVFQDQLSYWKDRFETIGLEDKDLPRIIKKRLLRPVSDDKAAELDEAFDQYKQKFSKDFRKLTGDQGDVDDFRRVYPFSPALIEVMVALSATLQRDRTALRELTRLLVEYLPDFELGRVVPVGDLFDVVAHGDISDLAAIQRLYENAMRIYEHELLPFIQQENGTKNPERCQLERDGFDKRLGCSGCPEKSCRTQTRIAKTVLLQGLVPNTPVLKNLTASSLVYLNSGTLKSVIPNQETSLAANYLRKWAGESAAVSVQGETNPTVKAVLETVDTRRIIESAGDLDNGLRRRSRIRDLLFGKLDIKMKGQEAHRPFEWNGRKWKVGVVYTNTRNANDAMFRPADGEDLRLILDYPFDEPGHGPAEDEKAIAEAMESGSRDTVVWLPTFLAERVEATLGELVILDGLMQQSDNALQERLSWISSEDLLRARGAMEQQRASKAAQIENALISAYGVSGAHEELLAAGLAPEKHVHLLVPDASLALPAEGDFSRCLEGLLRRAMEILAPRHPELGKAPTANRLSGVLEVIEEVVQQEGRRKTVSKTVADDVRAIAGAKHFDIVRVNDLEVIFAGGILDDMGKRLAGKGKLSVGTVREAIDPDQLMRLNTELEDFLILAYAATAPKPLQLVAHLQVVTDPVIGKLKDEVDLVEVELPSVTEWDRALKTASMFGIRDTNRALSPTKLEELATAVKSHAKKLEQAGLAELVTAHMTWLERLGIEEAADKTPRGEVLKTLQDLVLQVDVGSALEVAKALAAFEWKTERVTALTHMAGAERIAALKEDLTDETKWHQVQGGLKLEREQGNSVAAGLLTQLRDALKTDENLVQLRKALTNVGQGIVQLIVKQVDKPIAPPTPVAPVGDGGPAGPSAEEMGLPSSNSAVRMVANKTQLGQTVDYLEAMLKQDKRLRITIEVLDDDG